MSAISSLSLAAMLCALSGCNVLHPIRDYLAFRVVDADTAQPLAGVRVWNHATRNDETAPVPFYREHNFGPSKPDGIIRCCPAYTGADNIWVFRKAGYQESEALYNEDEHYRARVLVLHPIGAFWSGPRDPDSIWSPRDLIIIPMHREPASTRAANGT